MPARAQTRAAPGPILGPRGPGLSPGRRGASESVVHIWSILDGPYTIDFCRLQLKGVAFIICSKFFYISFVNVYDFNRC